MVGVAQLVERYTVAVVVVSSSLTAHPSYSPDSLCYTVMKKFLSLFSILLFFPTFLCFSQPDSLRKIKSSLYKEGDYKKSIQILRSFASSDSVSLDQRQNAMRILSRSYLAYGKLDEAYTTAQNLAKTGKKEVNWDPTKHPRILNYAYYRSLRDNKGSYMVGSKESHPEYMVLGVFEDGMSDFTIFGNSLSHFLNKELKESGKSVVERERVRWIVDEFSVNYLSVTPKKAYHFGRLTGIDKVIFGTYSSSDKLEVEIKVLDIHEAQLEFKNKFEENHENVTKLFERVVSSVVKDDMSYKETDLRAAFKYSKALNMSFENRYYKAKDLLREISKRHSKFEKAKERMKAVDPIIATY